MNLDGLWTVNFVINGNRVGGGVAFLIDGNLFGGDNSYYWMGAYVIGGENVSGKCRVDKFDPQAVNIFGTQHEYFEIEMEMKIDPDNTFAIVEADAKAIVGTASIPFKIVLNRRVELVKQGEQE